MNENKRIQLFLVLVVISVFTIPIAVTDAQDPTIRIETLPKWQSATLNIYIFGMPMDGGEYTQSSIIIRVAVWGATEDNPLIIQLDGEQAAKIINDGLFTYEWTLRGSHHILLRDRWKTFDQAAFNIEAPPPPPARILLSKFEDKLAEQFTSVIMFMIAATTIGVPSGIGIKKWTKITTHWVMIIPAIGVGLGIRFLPDLYMLIPWGIATSLTYQLAKPYATLLTLISFEENQVDASQSIYVDDDGKAILGIGPKYWRQGFILKKDLKIVDKYPITLNHYGLHEGICVHKLEETEDKITLNCDKALAKIIVEAGALEKATTLVDQLWTENTKLEALGEYNKEKEIRSQVKERVLAILTGRRTPKNVVKE